MAMFTEKLDQSCLSERNRETSLPPISTCCLESGQKVKPAAVEMGEQGNQCVGLQRVATNKSLELLDCAQENETINRPLPVAGTTNYGTCSSSLVCCLNHSNGNGSNSTLAQLVDPSGSGSPMAGQQEEGGADGSGGSANAFIQRLARRIPCLGILFALCASLFLGSAGMLVKLTTSIGGIQVAVIRSLIQLFIYGSIMRMKQLTLKPANGEIKAVAGRAILGGSSITLSYYALRLIPLGDATTIRFSLPIWTLIVSYFVLNESCSLLKVTAVFMSVSGVGIIAKPDECVYLWHVILHALNMESDGEFAREREEYKLETKLHLMPLNLSPTQEPYRQLEGSCLALCSSICLALSIIALRMSKRTSAESIIVWLSLVSIIIGSTVLLAQDEWRIPTNWTDILYVFLNGLCGSIGQWFITMALKIEQSGVISLARTFDIEIAFLYSAFLLNEQIRLTSILGSLLVSCGVVLVVLPKLLGSRDEQPNKSPTN